VVALALTLLSVGIADLVRGSATTPTPQQARRAGGAGVAPAAVVAALSGQDLVMTVALIGWVLLTTTAWLWWDVQGRSEVPAVRLLAGFAVGAAATVALSGVPDPVGGPLSDWWTDLPFPLTDHLSVDALLLAVGTGFWLLATGNRLVRLILTYAKAFPADEDVPPGAGSSARWSASSCSACCSPASPPRPRSS
jgi:hypothetical protein